MDVRRPLAGARHGNQSGLFGTFSTTTKNSTEAAREATAPRKRLNGVALIVTGLVLAGTLSSIGYALGTSGQLGPQPSILLSPSSHQGL